MESILHPIGLGVATEGRVQMMTNRWKSKVRLEDENMHIYVDWMASDSAAAACMGTP